MTLYLSVANKPRSAGRIGQIKFRKCLLLLNLESRAFHPLNKVKINAVFKTLNLPAVLMKMNYF
jgi:hypothetical protein